VADGVLNLLQRLQRELSLTLLFITHDFATVRIISDEVVVMRHGRVVERGARDSVMGAPQQTYTQELLASVPELDPDWLASVIGRKAERLATEATRQQ
jgi:peptide/nickel transport system ATP-binding protein